MANSSSSPDNFKVQILPRSPQPKQGPRLENPTALVTICVGPATASELKSFLVHKDFGKTQTYRLEGTTKDAVRLLVHWLYTQKLDIHQLDELRDLDDIARKEEKSLAELWVLVDRLLIPKLQNDVICLMEELRVHTGWIPTSTIPFVWENTQTTSPLRRYLLDRCTFDLDESWLRWSPSHFPKEMLLELATNLLAMRINGTKYKWHKTHDMAEYKVPEE